MSRALRRAWRRVLGVLRRRRADDELAQEIDTHIHCLAEEDIRRGLPADEAYRRARLRFGSVEAAKERYREQRGLPLLESTVSDIRYAGRAVLRAPAFAVTAILSLSIGVGAMTAVFSLVDAVLLRPLSYSDPDRLFVARELDPQLFGQRLLGVNPTHAREWAVQCPSIEQVAVSQSANAQLTGAGEPAAIRGARVSHNLFALLGVEPIQGRAFRAEEEQAGHHLVAMLSETLWRTQFQADPQIVGRAIELDGEPHQVVGIVSDAFRLPYSGLSNRRDDIFRPLVLPSDEIGRLMGNYNYFALVRLKSGATAGKALAEINVIQARFPRLAGVNADVSAVLLPVHEFVTSSARLGLWTLSAAVAAVLLIVCLNLANLLLSRSTTRIRETAIRTALGASRGRLVRQILTECLVLAGVGGALGVVVASVIVRWLTSAASLELPRIDEVRLDSTVIAFAGTLAGLTGLVFGAFPAWRLTRGDPQEALRASSHTLTEGRRAVRVREVLIGFEVGVSAALLIVAGLLGTSLVRLLQVDKGFDVGRVLTVDVNLAASRYTEPGTRERFLDRLLPQVAAIPGVEAAAVVTQLPIRGESWNDPIYLEGAPRERKYSVNNRYTSSDYFRVMHIAFRQGRGFDERDRGRGVAVLSERAAGLLWPGDPNPVGRLFMGEDDTLKTLVGIVADVRASLPSEPPPIAYYPYWQRPPDAVSLVVRAGDPHVIAAAVRAVLRGEDPKLPIPVVRTMEDVVDLAVAQRRFQSRLMTLFAGAALVVAALGIYGVVSYSVARRRNEMGIRLALGADRARVLGLVIRQGMRPVVAGLVAGVGAALLVGRAIRGLLFEVQPADPVTIAGVTVVLLVIGVMACFVPGRRAAATDAVSALRLQ
jgi:predicted permease